MHKNTVIGKTSLKIAQQIQHIDIMPTILDFVGIPNEDNLEGISLDNLIKISTDTMVHKYAFSEASRQK